MNIKLTHVSARISAGHRITLTGIVRDANTALATVAYDSAATPERQWTIFSVPGVRTGGKTAQERLLAATGATLEQMRAWLDREALRAIQEGLQAAWEERVGC